MTLAPSGLAEFDIDKIVRLAHIQSGLLSVYQPVDAMHAQYARDLLDTILKELEVEGIFAKSVSFVELTMVSGQFQYDVPGDSLDVFGTAMWIDATQALTSTTNANELPVAPLLRDQWQTQTVKSAESRPFYYYCHREFSVPQVWVWPTPGVTEAGGVLRLQVHRLRKDATDGTKTLDYERYWTQFFLWELAHQLSLGSGKDITRVQYLMGVAMEKKKKAKMYSAQRPPTQLSIGYAPMYRRR